MASAPDAANFRADKSRKCGRCRAVRPVSAFTAATNRKGLTCSLCRQHGRDRYRREKSSLSLAKRIYYQRKKAELSPVEWRANRLRYTYKVPVTVEWLERQWTRQAGRCAITGRALDWSTVQLDHIIPRARGGTDDLANFRLVCRLGNTLKRDLLDDELIELCREVLAELAQ